MNESTGCFAPVAGHTGDPISLAMQRLWLTGELTPAGARLSVQHQFRSEEKTPLEVIYSFPLPRDAALRRFRIKGEDFETHSQLKPSDEAEKAYEEGIAAGSLAALAQAYGDGVVNLTIGNIRPGETVTVDLEIMAGVELNDDGFRFRFPFTLAPRYHSRARFLEMAQGEGEMELPADEFGSVILPPVRKDASDLHEVGFELALALGTEAFDVGSPSHTIRTRHDTAGRSRVSLGIAADVPDRDLVLDLGLNTPAAQVIAAAGPGGAVRFAAIIPSRCFGEGKLEPRRVVFLLDRSGSMQGRTMLQARKALEACLAVLAESDEFGIVAFDDKPEVLENHLLRGSKENRRCAGEFLRTIDARGGTELVRGMEAACRVAASSGADIFILTDGQVAGTEQVLSRARANHARLHCLGIGSAAQDRFLTQLARETSGVSRCVNPDERVDLAAVNLFAAAGKRVATGLHTSPATRPEPPVTVHAGTPVLLFGESSAADQALTVGWDGGSLSLPIEAGGQVKAETLRLLQGARLISDWEGRYPAEDARAPLEVRKQKRVTTQLRSLSEEFGLASREMSLVAVVTRPGDRPGELPVTRVVPVGLPRGVDMAAYFGSGRKFEASVMQFCAVAPALSSRMSAAKGLRSDPGEFHAMFSLEDAMAAPPDSTDILMELAAHLEPDGGMPGKDDSERLTASAFALLAFLANGHTEKTGAFRLHVQRLVHFLTAATGVSAERQRLIQAVLDAARSGNATGLDWLRLAKGGASWDDLAAAFPSA